MNYSRESIASIDREESFAERIGALMERHCPRLMRCGGGALVTERPNSVGSRPYSSGVRATTPEQDKEILRLGVENRLTATEIAIAVGTTQSITHKRLRDARMTAPDGRKPCRASKSA